MFVRIEGRRDCEGRRNKKKKIEVGGEGGGKLICEVFQLKHLHSEVRGSFLCKRAGTEVNCGPALLHR